MNLILKKDKKVSEKVEKKVPGRTISQVTINSANIVDNADSQLLPSVEQQIHETTNLSLDSISLIISVRSLLQAITTPMWGWWSDHHSRKKVLAIGCFIWGLCTIIIGSTSSFIDMMIFRGLTGVGLAVIIPTAQSLLADYFPPEKRGKAYGWFGLTGVIGVVFGTLFATAVVQQYDTILGIASWVFCFYVWGAISIAIGFLVLFFTKEPPRGQMDVSENETATSNQPEKYRMQRSDYREIFTNKSFMLIVLQGVAGSLPWTGILLMVPWLEWVGFDDLTAGLAFAIVAVGSAVGNLLGGYIGDKAAKWKPKSGRIIIAQISVFSGIPLTYIIFIGIPMNPSSLLLYIVTGAITGILISWSGYGTNSPIFSELFAPELRSSVFAVDRMFEGSISAFGTSIASVITVLFGFKDLPVSVKISSLGLNDPLRIANMHALALGMFYTAFIPWIICLILYTLVYFTYPKDREAIRNKMLERRKDELRLTGATEFPTSIAENGDPRIRKIKQMLAVSTRIRQVQMRKALHMPEEEFNEKVWTWAQELGFKIDGDYIDTTEANVEGFIAQLDQKFIEWNQDATKKAKKT